MPEPNKIAPIQIAIVGDVHDRWEPAAEAAALEALGVQLVLFVGDFGNEAVDLVREIATLPLPKAVAFGNHDAWYTASDWGRKKCPYDPKEEDRVQEQIDLLGADHIGYGCKEFSNWQLAIVGGRPFSWGGTEWRNARFYRERFSVSNFEESTARIVAAAAAAQSDRLIFLCHNGPQGLGADPADICGRDWKDSGGDFGDPDLTAAIIRTRSLGKVIPLVAFGHMHHNLKHRGDRLRTTAVIDERGTTYVNAARVPRIIVAENGRKQRNYTLVTLGADGVGNIELVWVAEGGVVTSREAIEPLALEVAA
ncbi:MAG: TIGR04168 family protein [Cyanobacteria bacterium J06641_5]